MLKTKAGRTLASAFTRTVLLDAAFAYLIASQFANDDVWFSFFAALAIFWILPVLFALKSVLYKALFYFLNRSSVRQTLVQEFRRAGLPLLSGTEFNDPADLYFAQVAQDDSLPKSARLFAAQVVGQLALVPTYSSADTLILHANLDVALSTYFDQLRRQGVKPHRENNRDRIGAREK